jgi:hypothetical protein
MGVCDKYPYDYVEDDFCFHINSIIDYKGTQFTYEELKMGKETECTIPHSRQSRGVIVSTSCNKTVRVTDTHLMATPHGYRLAYSLKPGDELFQGYSNTDICVVQSITKEASEQQYFGLNCAHSEVLVSGIRASTFGDFHTLPSWYMKYVGRLFGTSLTSQLGNHLVKIYNYFSIMI